MDRDRFPIPSSPTVIRSYGILPSTYYGAEDAESLATLSLSDFMGSEIYGNRRKELPFRAVKPLQLDRGMCGLSCRNGPVFKCQLLQENKQKPHKQKQLGLWNRNWFA